MLQQILLLLLGILVTYLTYIIINPLVQLLYLKMKHGKDIHIEFIPIIGEILSWKRAQTQHKDIEYFTRKIIQQKPEVKVMNLQYSQIIVNNFFLDRLVVTLVDPQLIKQFLQAPEKYRKFDFLIFNDLVFSQGLLFTEDQLWKDQRKIIAQQFTFENLRCRIPVIKNLTQEVFTKHIELGQELKLLEVVSKITGQVLTQTFFGKEFSEQLLNGLIITDAVVECIALQFYITTRSIWTQVRSLVLGYNSGIPRFLLTQSEKVLLSKLKNLHDFVNKGIAKREESFDENEKIGNQDFIQIYLAESKKINRTVSKEELLHQFTAFAFAGTDTTSTLVTMTCYILSQKPDLQEQIRRHVKEHVQSFDELSHQDLPKLDQLNALCLEVLRVYPPANGIIPRRPRQQHQLGNFTMKTHYMIDCGIIAIQQNSLYYEKPLEFNINRWLNKELKEVHAYVPFSSGPRNCIGQHLALTEAKIILSYIFLNYKIIPDTKRVLEMTLTSLYAPVDDRLVIFQAL